MSFSFDSFLIPIIIVAIGLAIATMTDLRTLKIPNRLTVPMLLLGVTYHASVHGLSGILFSTIGLVTGFTLLVVFYALGLVGAGDVKILAAIGAWLGPIWICFVFVATSLCLGTWRIGQLGGFPLFAEHWSTCLGYQESDSQIQNSNSEASSLKDHQSLADRQQVIPYAPNLCVGFLVILFCFYV